MTFYNLDDDRDKHFAEKVKRLKIRFITFILVTIIVAAVMMSDFLPGFGGAIVLGGFGVYVLVFYCFLWRCPKCGAMLGRDWLGRYCSRCGTEII